MTEELEQNLNEQPETPVCAMPALNEITVLPWKNGNPYLHLLAAALTGFLAAVPVIAIVWGKGANMCSGAVVLFMAFVAVAIQHALSKFAFPAGVDQSLPHGVSTMLLIGQVLGMYLLFLNTAFYGSTAFVTAALISISMSGRLVMIWQAKYPNAWLCTLVVSGVVYLLFRPFHPETLSLPLDALLTQVPWDTIKSPSMAGALLSMPALGMVAAIWYSMFMFRKCEDRKTAAIASVMFAELLVLFAFLLVSEKLTFFQL